MITLAPDRDGIGAIVMRAGNTFTQTKAPNRWAAGAEVSGRNV
jgi:hypothetical protein